jgi:hypothetical protein
MRPPAVTRQGTGGCKTRVGLHGGHAAMIPGCAPRYVGAASTVPRVSRTACNNRGVITGPWGQVKMP